MLSSLDADKRLDDTAALWAAAHELEHLFHGTPSGIDTGLAIHPGANIVFPDPPALPSIAPATLPRMQLLVGAVPRTTGTAELVAGIRTLRERNPRAVNARLAHLGELSRKASSCGSAREIGEMASEAQEELAALGLSTPVLESALSTAIRNGALGAKLSGAGGGGAFYAVFEENEGAQQALAALRSAVPELVYLATIPVGGHAPGGLGR
jgi:mevalonate kinase